MGLGWEWDGIGMGLRWDWDGIGMGLRWDWDWDWIGLESQSPVPIPDLLFLFFVKQNIEKYTILGLGVGSQGF